MRNSVFSFLFIVFVVQVCAIPDAQITALSDLYAATNGDAWTLNTGWVDADEDQLCTIFLTVSFFVIIDFLKAHGTVSNVPTMLSRECVSSFSCY